jgi:uncharacterized protein (TIGR03083 family)
MTVFEMIADERRGLAALLATLTEEQLRAPSLVPTWTVRDVAGHLVLAIEFSMPRLLLTLVRSGFSIDRTIDRMTWRMARRPIGELAAILRAKAESRFAPPGTRPEAILTEVLIHDLDLRWPLKIAREIPEERTLIALKVVTETPARGFVGKGWRDGLRFAATDLAWAHGQGALVRGPADALLLGITGRRAALSKLEGDGVGILRERFGGC